ncbi:hypothetical protein [Methanolapillus millepedarum]|uniref:VWFA domain-containing protein n=1 Tax=Methanolapillus millepedarum TaxID=3028296 RepID=A0AA96VG63_9EURY|nr:hypothetical protein MsAc7_15540 [Methanosarcinaceae archaeon Ac7]
MKNIFKLTALFFVLLFLAAPLASAAGGSINVYDESNVAHPTVKVLSDYCADSPSKYDLSGPVASGTITVIDNGVWRTNKTQFDDLVTINKEVVKSATPGEYDVTMTIDVVPGRMTYYPPPKLDVIFVYDVTSSMLDDIDDKGTLDTSDNEPIRLRNAQDAIMKSAESIWAQNPESTITIIPFARDVFEPLPTGGFEFNNTKMYTSAGYSPDIAYNTGIVPEAYMIGSLDNETYKKLVNSTVPANLSGNTAYVFGNDINHLYYRVTKADVNNMTNGTSTFNQSILDIPMGKDTNTEGGLTSAYNFLTTDSNFTANTEQNNRVVILVTDGNAGRYYLSNGDVSIGGYNRYDVLTANLKAREMSSQIKDPSDGNAVVYALGIGVAYAFFSGNGWQGYTETIDGRTEITPEDGVLTAGAAPLGLSYIDVAKFLSKIPTSNAHYFNANDMSLIDDMMEQAVQSSTYFWAPVDDIVVQDQINTTLFEYNAGSYSATVSVDGGAPGAATATGDSDYSDGNISLNLENPQVLATSLASTSTVQYVIKYTITDVSVSSGDDHVHISDDNRSYVKFTAPDHLEPSKAKAVYPTKNTYYIPFNTPTIAKDAISVKKEVSLDGTHWSRSADLPNSGGTVHYRVTVTNGYSTAKTLEFVADKVGGTSNTDVYKAENDLLGNATLAGGSYAPGTGLGLTDGESATLEYTRTLTGSGTHKNLVVIEDGSGVFRNATATVVVEASGSGGTGNGTVVPPKEEGSGFAEVKDNSSQDNTTTGDNNQTTPTEEICEPFAYTWVFLLIVALALVQSAFLYKKYKTTLANKWWIVLAILFVLVIATSAFVYANHCSMSNVWIGLPVILTLLMIPVIYLYNKYTPLKLKM